MPYPGTKHLTLTAYQLQTSWKADQFNKTIISRLQHYQAEHQRHRDRYMQLLTYAYIAQGHISTSLSSFTLFLSRHPPGPITFDNPTVLQTDVSVTTYASTEGKNITPACDNVPRRWYAKEIVAATIYRWSWSENFQWATVVHCRWYIYLDRLSMTTSVAKRLLPKPYNKLLPCKTS